jgi:predicted glycoside hydrolase/deacetylase ChbG (UPF0249 family)
VYDHEKNETRLIVNADDYGYFDAVSRGILDAHAQGIVTATGILANSAGYDAHVARLFDFPNLDLGVHLNLTHGLPLSAHMWDALAETGGRFAGVTALLRAMLTRRLTLDAVEAEWRAQIERCLSSGLTIRFLNSHQHVHMLPPLYRLTLALADDYGIPYVRHSMPERMRRISFAAMLRGGVLAGLAMLNARHRTSPGIAFLGFAESGRLGPDYFRWMLPTLKPGHVYELMCHPGHAARGETEDPHLWAYHDWEGELALMTQPETRALLARHHIRLIGYRELTGLGREATATPARGAA